jgi:deoxyribose-phosphate aldolase
MGKRDKKKDSSGHVRPVPDLPSEGELERNPGTELELDWVHSVRVNRSAVERRAATIPGRRAIKKEWQLAWLLRAIAVTDLTTLQGDDTPGRVRRLCAKARHPIQPDILAAIGAEDLDVQVAAVCVYHDMVPVALEALEGSGIPVAAVSAGFPAGLSPLKERIREVEASVEAGATEIDIVIHRAHLFTGNWQAMYDEVKAFREACGDKAHLKSIIATGDLAILRNVARASLVCMMAGSDFIKTSTGKEAVNATLPVSLVMVRMVREFLERTGHKVGFKAAGGISQAKLALSYLAMMKDELGRAWLEPELFRFGASSLVGDIERQLEFHATGRYSAGFRHPMT